MTTIEGSGEEEVLDGVFSREVADEQPSPQLESTDGVARDDKGRFAPKTPSEPESAQEQAPPPSSTEDPRSGHMVPVAELTGTRTKLQARISELERLHIEAEARAKVLEQMHQRQPQQATQFQQPQQQFEPPDFLTDPEGAINFRLQQQQEAFVNQMLNQSEIMARDKYGDQVVDAALEAVRAAGPSTAASFINNPHPWGEMVKWHKRQRTLQVVGDDPEAYQTKLETELRAKILAELKAPKPAPTTFPGTLATATASGEQGALLTDEAAMGSIFSSARDRRRG
jgi:hypothetical protein